MNSALCVVCSRIHRYMYLLVRPNQMFSTQTPPASATLQRQSASLCWTRKKQIGDKCCELRRTRDVMLLHDEAPVHKSEVSGCSSDMCILRDRYYHPWINVWLIIFFLYFNLSWVLWTCSTLVGVVIFRLSGRWNFFSSSHDKNTPMEVYSVVNRRRRKQQFDHRRIVLQQLSNTTPRVNTIGYGSLWVLLQKTSIFSISWYSVVVIFFQEAFIL